MLGRKCMKMDCASAGGTESCTELSLSPVSEREQQKRVYDSETIFKL